MRPDLPWNVAGIPSEAREAARAAARREGLSIGEWLTRRILAGLSDMNEPHQSSYREPYREEWNGDRAAARRDSDEMLDRVSRSETETSSVYRRIEEQLRGMSRRLDSAERSQSENNRVMSKAAVEMNIASREQAQAFDQLGAHVIGLSERIERMERQGNSDTLRDAVKALHQGLSRLADQITETANQSATQITALAGNLENLAGRLGQARRDSEASARGLETRIATLDDRVRNVEKAAQANAAALEHALESLDARQKTRKDDSSDTIARLEENMRRIEARNADPALDRRLSGIERALSDIVSRIDHAEDEPESVEDGLKRLAQRLEASEAAQREAVAELRKAIVERPQQKAPEPPPPEPSIFASPSAPFSPLPAFDAPPFPEPADNKPPFADPAFMPPPAYDMATGGEQPFSAGQIFGAEPPPQQPTVDSYLSAARRSARAASQAETERGNGALGGFAWNPTSAKPTARRSGRTLYLGIGVLALAAIAVIAGAILSHRTSSESPANSAIGALFQKQRPAPAMKPSTSPDQPSRDLGTTSNQQTAQPAQKPAAPAVQTPSPQTALRPTVKPAPAHNTAAAEHPQVMPSGPQKTAMAPNQPAATRPPAKLGQTAAIPALDRLTALANAGNARAELVVALKYLDGDGVPVNDTEAFKWLSRSAQAGEPVAQYRLGTMYERGRGTTADQAKAVQWYQAAANQGNRKAMHNLAVAYAEGSGVKKDFAEASRWFARAANLGLSDSQFNLAVLYERGLGVPQSLLNAYKWYAIAAAQGDAESKARLQAIAPQMSADDHAAAQHAADTFRPAPLDPRANVSPTMADVLRG